MTGAGTPLCDRARIWFHVDSTIQRPDARNCAHTNVDTTPTLERYEENLGYRKARQFSGHYVTSWDAPLTAGWHTVGLGVIADIDVSMTRIHACDIVVLTFKRP